MIKCDRDKCKKIIKRFFFLSAGFALIILPGLSFGQGELPCNDYDPYNSNCPIDSWVVVLGLIMAVGTAIHLYRRKKKTGIV
jgi:LPXTG-motif cell wall-anchored protein